MNFPPLTLISLVLLECILSWLFIRFFNKGNLRVLGLGPNSKNLVDFLLFILIGALSFFLDYGANILLRHDHWIPYSGQVPIVQRIGLIFFGALFEELIFHGILFYMLVKKAGTINAIWISSLAFGIFNAINYQLWGHWTEFIKVLFLTGILGFVYGYGFIKSGSMVTALALHFGANLIAALLFTNQMNAGLLILSHPENIKPLSFSLSLMVKILPALSTLILGMACIRIRNRNTEPLSGPGQ